MKGKSVGPSPSMGIGVPPTSSTISNKDASMKTPERQRQHQGCIYEYGIWNLCLEESKYSIIKVLRYLVKQSASVSVSELASPK